MVSFSEYSILLFQDNISKRDRIVSFLEYNVKTLYSVEKYQDAQALFLEKKPNIILADIASKDALQLLQNIREFDDDIPIILIVQKQHIADLAPFLELDIDAYWSESSDFAQILKILKKVIKPMELEWKLLEKNRYMYDALTGLPNFLKMDQEIESKRYSHILLLDISNFSTVNKQYGKSFSNKILKAIAQELLNHTTTKISLFKAESDRFVFLSQEEDPAKIEMFCQQIVGFFDTQTIKVEDLFINISFSIGIARIIDKEFSLVNAEYALEFGKGLGSRYYYFFDNDAKNIQKEKDVIKWLSVTKDMLENNQIEPYYQPIVEIATGKIVKYEVLARGDYKGQLYSPYQFLGSAERMGLISSLTRMIVNKSFAYFEGTDNCFSINLTQRDLLDKYLISFLEQKLSIYKIEPSQVTFEILENVTSAEYVDILIKQIKDLKALGFEIAIDDFGIENSTFSRLLDIDFDYLKIDAAFIKNLEDASKKDRVIVSAIVGMAKGLGIPTIAEFVKNKEILEIVKEMGVDMAQGEYFGQPEKITLKHLVHVK